MPQQSRLDLSITFNKGKGDEVSAIVKRKEAEQRRFIYEAYLKNTLLERVLIDRLRLSDNKLQKRIEKMVGGELGELYFFVKDFRE